MRARLAGLSLLWKFSLLSLVTVGALGVALTVVAEGLETEEVRARVTELGCTVAQGFLFGHPLASDELAAWLEARAAAAR